MNSLIHTLTLAIEGVRVGSQETTLRGGAIGRQSPPHPPRADPQAPGPV